MKRISRVTGSFALAGMMVGQLWMLAGCASTPAASQSNNNSAPTGALASGGANTVYVIQAPAGGAARTVLAFSATANGAVTPTGTLTLPANFIADSVTTDSTGQIYVGGGGPTSYNSILVYAAGATGAATPLRNIQFSYGLASPNYMAVDASGKIYVSGYLESVSVFAAGANGITMPLTTFSANALNSVSCLAVDSSGDIYVCNETSTTTGIAGSILVFSPGSNGTATPVRTITSGNFISGVALDSSGNIYASESTLTITSTTITAVGLIPPGSTIRQESAATVSAIFMLTTTSSPFREQR
jgi:hypothetical protein